MMVLIVKRQTNIIKKYHKRYQDITKRAKTKSENMVANDISISQKLKSKG